MSLNEPGALYDAAKALHLQDVPVMTECDPDAMLWQEQALKTQVTPARLTPILARTGHQYRKKCPYPTTVTSKFMSTTTWV